MSAELVWFKRDLRVVDHAPLRQASERGPVLPLYIVEPSLQQAPDWDPRHWAFIRASLAELRKDLAKLGQPLIVREGEALAVLQGLHRQFHIARIWAHEETGNALTYARDVAVAKWARAVGIEFLETPGGGVVRRLKSRDGWAKIWEGRMAQPIVAPPARLLPVKIEPGHLAAAPGVTHASELLESFLAIRGRRYHREMSSPVTAFESCSRLSPHLAYGTISTRMVVQRVRQSAANTEDTEFKRAMRAFDGRLHWRDHFMQKLEDEPAIEFHNFVRGFDGLREGSFNADYFAAWAEGRTGYPMVDACMRCLKETGWINFRMRAMLTSFASYHLWLHWRETGLHLARLFTDYEPGIHWSQVQMQSGTTGMNTLRIYNPLKQALDHDPDGVFVRRWLGDEAVKPIVDHAAAVKEARAKLTEFRRRSGVRTEIQAVTKKHGSRKKTTRPKARRPAQPETQGVLFEDP